MFTLLAMALLLTPMAVLLVCERAAKKGRGPLAHPGRMPVPDSRLVSPTTAKPPAQVPPPTGLVFTGSGDAERCAAESLLVRGLLDGTLDRARYHSQMADLAAATASPPVRLPGEPG